MWPAGALCLLWTLPATLLLARTADGQGARLWPDRYCLSCLCTAATGCDVNVGCRQDGDLNICGPFYMSEPYWLDANLTGMAAFEGYAFEQCATDVECAGQAVSSYMHAYSRDCDGDGRVTCRDFGLMHFLGYHPCGDAGQLQAGLRSAFYTAFSTCLDRMAGLLEREEFVPAPGYAPPV